MGVSTTGLRSPRNFSQTGINANALTNSNSFNIGMATNVVLQVLANSGTHTTHILQIQCALDGTNWEDIVGATITGLGIVSIADVAAEFIRARVSTVEGAASIVDIKMQAK